MGISFSLRIPILLIAGALMLTAGAGCTEGLILRLFNNSRLPLTIVVEDVAGDQKRYSVEAGESITTEIPATLRIIRSTNQWTYRLTAVPNSFKKRRGLRPAILKLQVNSAGLIYVLKSETERVADELPEQPRGYPLYPIETKNK